MFSHTGHRHALEIIGGLEASLGMTIAQQLEAARPPPPPEPEPESNLAHPDDPNTPAVVPKKQRDEQVAAYKRNQTNAQKEHNDRIAKKNKVLKEKGVAKDPFIKTQVPKSG